MIGDLKFFLVNWRDRRNLWLIPFLAVFHLTPAVSESNELTRIDVARALNAMNKRVRVAVEAQAKRLELGSEWVEYCSIETARKLAPYPKDGSVPFGSDFFKDLNVREILSEAIDTKEVYLRQDQILCLSGVKRTLSGLDRTQP